MEVSVIYALRLLDARSMQRGCHILMLILAEKRAFKGYAAYATTGGQISEECQRVHVTACTRE